jgi:hypothetical protein
MKTLLLCGYRSSDLHDEDPIGLQRAPDGLTLIDRRVHQLTELGLDVLCVLAGRTADHQLRECPSIAATELVFDTNESDVSLTTNLKAGLTAAVGEPCFALPVEVPCPPKPVWDFLVNGWGRDGMQGGISLVQAMTPQGAPWHYGLPVLITRFGNKELRTLPGLNSLLDTRLKYLHLVYPEEANLASAPKPA